MVEVLQETTGIELTVDGPHAGGIPVDSGANTAGVAAIALMTHHGITDGVRLRITKGIRCGSGTGSSAASAAAAVTAVDAFFALGCSREQLVRFAAEGERASAGAAHADNVAAAVFGGLTICDARGRESVGVTHLTPPADLRVVIALPEIKIATSVARAALPEGVPMADYSAGCARCAMIVAALMRGDIAAFGRAVEGSFVDRVRGALIPGFEAVRKGAKAAGAAGVTISGAGPAVAAIMGVDGDPEGVARAMRAGFSQAGVESDIHIAGVADGAAVLEMDA